MVRLRQVLLEPGPLGHHLRRRGAWQGPVCRRSVPPSDASDIVADRSSSLSLNTSGQLVDWECGGRDELTARRLIDRLQVWNARLYCADEDVVYTRLRGLYAID